MPGGEGGGGRPVIENPQGGVSRAGGEGSSGRERVCGDSFGGGGAKYFFSGPKFPPSIINSTYEEHPERVRPFPKKVGTPRVWKPPGLASPKMNIY